MVIWCKWREPSPDGILECAVCGRRFTVRMLHRLPIFRQCAGATAPIPSRVQPQPATAADLPCIHRGPRIGGEECQLCGYRGRIEEVFECAVHGECTANRWSQTARGVPTVCLTCGDRRAEP